MSNELQWYTTISEASARSLSVYSQRERVSGLGFRFVDYDLVCQREGGNGVLVTVTARSTCGEYMWQRSSRVAPAATIKSIVDAMRGAA